MPKFQLNERVRIKSADPCYAKCIGREAVIIGLPGCCDEWPKAYQFEFVGPRPPCCPWGDLLYAAEDAFQKLLPDSDTYRPAQKSLDDILRDARKAPEVEVV